MSSLRASRLRAATATLPPSSVPEGPRRRILEVALQLFASEGFHGTSVRDIAKPLELQPSALYAHFPSKEHVLAELVRVGHEVHAVTLQAALRDAGDDPLEQICALVRAHTLLHATYPHLSVVVNEEIYALTADLAAPALAIRAQSLALVREVLVRGVAMGRFSVPDEVATAAALSAIGVRLPYWYAPSEALSLDELADVHVELSLRMLRAYRSPGGRRA
ncbi:TetR/AcrR family transcriptional regulator [Polyangium mundeleinium]|uniref:TetR/AcrR family transcriptional regulator n=1 Tax=Polyangium mundeleinium TaxID=2995306 RepID=A0ABT5EU56_9BACT|nr:TetR/AcrR family transcriptional regulator [Polyangium mundeleinium]MDC0745365.1 TetR/AcrR family transcriptional regulator [Polyangium mundeleinium]